MYKVNLLIALSLIVISSSLFAQAKIPAQIIIDRTQFYSQPDTTSHAHRILNEGDSVTVINIVSDFFHVIRGSSKGYIKINSVKDCLDIQNSFYAYQDSLMTMLENTQKELMQIYTKKFGKKIAQRLLDNEIWIGMTSEMALYSYGDPDKTNRYVNSNIVQETWYYYDRGITLSFVNDKLESWWE